MGFMADLLWLTLSSSRAAEKTESVVGRTPFALRADAS